MYSMQLHCSPKAASTRTLLSFLHGVAIERHWFSETCFSDPHLVLEWYSTVSLEIRIAAKNEIVSGMTEYGKEEKVHRDRRRNEPILWCCVSGFWTCIMSLRRISCPEFEINGQISWGEEGRERCRSALAVSAFHL